MRFGDRRKKEPDENIRIDQRKFSEDTGSRVRGLSSVFLESLYISTGTVRVHR